MTQSCMKSKILSKEKNNVGFMLHAIYDILPTSCIIYWDYDIHKQYRTAHSKIKHMKICKFFDLRTKSGLLELQYPADRESY